MFPVSIRFTSWPVVNVFVAGPPCVSNVPFVAVYTSSW